MSAVRVLVMLFLASVGLAGVAGVSQSREEPASQRVALLATIDGVIGPASARYVNQAVAAAEARDAAFLILQMDTPGGLVTSMRDTIADILASPKPVIGFVAPSGGHAASAGTYILYATHIAAMAPGTNIGAATPVQMGGPPGLPSLPGQEDDEDEDQRDDAAPPEAEEVDEAAGDASEDDEGGSADRASDDARDSAGDRDEPAPPPPGDALSAKAVNDAVAYIRSLAELRGRNAEWAEKAVRGAAAITPQEALDLNVIEIVADDLDDLLAQIDGRTVEIDGEAVTIATDDLAIEPIEPTFMTRVLDVIANPNVAFIFMLVGVYGLIFELAQPGTIGPGVIGLISLVIGLYALNQLPLNYAGAALVVIGVIFMVTEALTPSFGVFGVGGFVAFVVGAAMLFDTDVPEYRLSWPVIAAAAATSGLILIVALGSLWRSMRAPSAAGPSGLVGATVTIQDWSGGRGHALAHGERWTAVGEGDLQPGDNAHVTRVEGLTLHVARTP